jgi:hypothetical protein
MFTGESCTFVNRTDRPLPFRFDGREYYLRPGDNENFPRVLVRYAMDQCRIMGTEDPLNPKRYDSLCGIKGVHDTSPVKQNTEALERWDRSKMPGRGKKGKPIAGDPVTAFEARVAEADPGGEGAIDGLAAAMGNESEP